MGSVSTTLLTGTFLNSLDDPMFAQQFGPSDPSGCNPAGTSSVAFSGRGPVSGPLPGTIQVNGSYQIGPQSTSRDLGFVPSGSDPALAAPSTISAGHHCAGHVERLVRSGHVGLNEGACSGSRPLATATRTSTAARSVPRRDGGYSAVVPAAHLVRAAHVVPSAQSVSTRSHPCSEVAAIPGRYDFFSPRLLRHKPRHCHRGAEPAVLAA